ncbi:MAG: murein biosynthesis integral membrane protein MurJ [Bacillota bacterium]
MSTRKRIFQAAFVVMLLNVLSKILGFTREQIFAMFFGATGEIDAKVAAEKITSVIAVLSGPVSTTFLPVFASFVAKGDDEGAKRTTSSIITLSTLLVLAVALALFIPAPYVVRLMSPGFGEETLRTATMLTRVLLPAMLLPLLIAFAKSVLNTYENFAVPAFAPSIQNMILIATAALFGPVMGVKSLAIGFPSAYIAALALHVPAWRRSPSWPSFSVHLDESTKKVLLMAVPIVLGSVFTQVYMLTNLRLASRLAEGSVAALSFADRLRQFPLGFFAMAVTTVIFPTLSGMWSKGDREGFKSTAVNGIRFVEFVCIPAAVGLMVLAKPIVRLVFERGAFVPEHTAAVASALTAYSPALAGMAALSVISFVFYASQETRVPVALAVGTALLNVALDVILVGPLGHVGLALANSVSQTVGALVGVYLLNRLLRDLPLRSLSNSLIKVLVSSAVMGAAAFELSRYSGFHGGTGNVLRDLLTGGIVMGAAVLVYGITAVLLKAEETQMLIGLTRTRLAPRLFRYRKDRANGAKEVSQEREERQR